MIVKQMIEEEWRMHSRLFSGRSFAAFPFMIFTFAFLGSYAALNYSTLGLNALNNALSGLGFFIGLAVGSVGFSSKDMVKNVLGSTNYIVYSSRTLPLSKNRLLAAFIAKDLVYYSLLFLLPILIGASTASGTVVGVPLFFYFIGGLTISFVMARTSLNLPIGRVRYNRRLKPLTMKSMLDVWRSSGGIIKVFFSLGVLTLFYWTVALHFPFANPLMSNPLLSYSVLLGTVSLTVYNWLNRFDSPDDYLYLSVSRKHLLEAKQEAYLYFSLGLTTLFLLISMYLYPGNIGLAFSSMVATQLYTLGVASYLTGLEPNTRLFDTAVFMRYLAANSLLVMPLLVLSIFYTQGLVREYVALLLSTSVVGVVLAKISR